LTLVEAEAAARWNAARSPTAAARFSDALEEAEAAILERPEAWPMADAGTRPYLLQQVPLSAVYRVEESRVLIVAIAHERRRPGYWKRGVPGSA